jgi:hypothetical protein
MADPQASPGGAIANDGSYTRPIMHRHDRGESSFDCADCVAAAERRTYFFEAAGCVCDHEDWMHSYRGCVVGASEMTRCPCPASWSDRAVA